MVSLILSVLFFGLAFSLLDLKKSLNDYSLKEAKYLANQGDNLAKKIQKIIAYKESYNLALIILIVISLILSFIFIRQLPNYLFVLLLLIYLLLIFLFNKKYKSIQKFLINIFSPILTFLLNYLHPPLKTLTLYLHLKQEQKPLVFDSIDLIKFIDQVSKKSESRLDRDDVQFTKSALKLSDTKIKDLCLKWSRVKKLRSDEKIGPILLDELYKKKQPFIPILNNDKEVIGVLNVNSLTPKHSGKVEEYMSSRIYFIDEEDNITDLISAINKTSSEVFIVVDYSSKYAGIVSYLDILNLFKTTEVDSSKDYSSINK